jgi:hypothetical protein
MIAILIVYLVDPPPTGLLDLSGLRGSARLLVLDNLASLASRLPPRLLRLNVGVDKYSDKHQRVTIEAGAARASPPRICTMASDIRRQEIADRTGFTARLERIEGHLQQPLSASKQTDRTKPQRHGDC